MARRAVAATSTLLLALVAGPALAASQAPQGVPARAQATRTTAAIRVDGRLDEDAWQHAQLIGKLTQREPLEGAEASETTDVRWILQPGNDVFLVLNRGWDRSLIEDRCEPLFDRGSVKLQYTFRF